MVRRAALIPFIGVLATCATERVATKNGLVAEGALPVSSPAELCNDPRMSAGSLCVPPSSVQRALFLSKLELLDVRHTRAPQVLKIRGALDLGDRRIILWLKWRASPPKVSDAFNNSPRKELAAHALSAMLFPKDALVPPATLRCLRDAERAAVGATEDTFKGIHCTLGIVALWLQNVKPAPYELFDPARYQRDASYRRATSRLNVFAYLIDHGDSHSGNFLVSTDPLRRRIFSVDHGFSLGGFFNPAGRWFKTFRDWSQIFVPSIPQDLYRRLRSLDRIQLRRLSSLVEFRIEGDRLVPIPAGPPLDPKKGVRRTQDRLQIGLKAAEIARIEERIVKLLKRVQEGSLSVDRAHKP